MDFNKENDFSNQLFKKWHHETDNLDSDVIPMWIADMDFQTSPAVTDALVKRAKTGIYGYAYVPSEYNKAIIDWFYNKHNWKIESNSIIQTPGVVPALHIALQAFSEKSDKVLLQTPVYHPFYRVCEQMQRQIIENPLIYKSDSYEVDWNDLENKLKNEKPKLMILCSPHNPIGKVFSKDELYKIGQLCLKYKTLLVSDEIHCDIVYSDSKFIPFATIDSQLTDNAIICTAPSKTFNIAGLYNSNIIISNNYIRDKFIQAKDYFGFANSGPFPLVATIAAYEHGALWQHEVMKYIEDNRNFALDFIQKNIPKLLVHKPQGTYFLWLNFSAYNFKDKNELESFLLKQAKLWLNQGSIFGNAGTHFARMNIACTKSILTKALQQLATALEKNI